LSSSSASFTFYGINNASSASSNTININNNQIKNITTSSASGYNEGIYAGTASVLNCNSNTIDNITRDAAGFLCGIQYYTPASATFNGNSISNLITTSTTSTNGVYGLYSGNAAVNEYIYGNSIFNLTSYSTANQYIYCIASGTGSSGKKIIQNNNVYNISGSGMTIYGIYVTYGSTTEIKSNNIYGINGGQLIYGIYSYAAASTNNIYKNKVYNLSSANANASVTGIFLNNAVTTNIYNNFISDLQTSASTSSYAIMGIYIVGGTNANLFYNTIFLNASSTGASFSTSCLFSYTGPIVDLRNNILVNLSAHSSGGNTVSFRSNGPNLSTYSPNSNNNCFYAGMPGTNNLIFFDGSNRYQTIASYKLLTGLSPRDAASFSENPPFVNTSSTPYDLHLKTGAYTQCESGGTPLDNITEDYDGVSRDFTKPDVGADEGSFTASAVWLGITSNSWSTATNWGNGMTVPSSNQNILINKTGTYNPLISGNTTIGGLYINESNSFTVNSGQSLAVNGNLSNYGTFTDNGGTLSLSGPNLQSLGGTGLTTLYNVSVNNPNGISMTGNINVNGLLALSNGILDLNHNNINLGSTGNLSETQTSYINQSNMSEPFGTITATRTLNQPSGYDIAGLGIKITSASNLGSTSVIRGVERKSDSNGNLAIARYYDIAPSNNTGLNATVVFGYNISELGGGIQEGNLTIFKSTNNGSTWTLIDGVLNTTNKTITVSGVNDFSIWTFGDRNAPLPVELLHFRQMLFQEM
ncbi:MAG: hypothetical protein LWX07_11360, partial [Bacteroidetes bacterium]|nr:hypothetical protein [Bacteroidota bacterium]